MYEQIRCRQVYPVTLEMSGSLTIAICPYIGMHHESDQLVTFSDC
jgi:hypothetical protein